MIFWIILAASGLLAWLGVNKGIYTMIAAFFNLLIAVYVGVLSTPLVLSTSPGLEASGYYAAFCMLLLVTASFALLQGVCWYFFLRGADILFPVLFDKIGGGIFGFLTGYAVMAVIFLALSMMPFSRLDSVQKFCPVDPMANFASNTSVRICSTVGAWSFDYIDKEARQTVDYLIDLGLTRETFEQAPSEKPAEANVISPSLSE